MRIVVALAIAIQGMAVADAQTPRLELWAGVSVSPTGPSGELASAYSPPLLLDGDFTSHGGQTLTFSGRTTAGFEGGANVFLVPHAGIPPAAGFPAIRRHRHLSRRVSSGKGTTVKQLDLWSAGGTAVA